MVLSSKSDISSHLISSHLISSLLFDLSSPASLVFMQSSATLIQSIQHCPNVSGRKCSTLGANTTVLLQRNGDGSVKSYGFFRGTRDWHTTCGIDWSNVPKAKEYFFCSRKSTITMWMLPVCLILLFPRVHSMYTRSCPDHKHRWDTDGHTAKD
jgi:hypothetical protein